MFTNLVFINPGRYTVEALLATTLESDWLWSRELVYENLCETPFEL